jgi:hypothetical protein
MKRGTPRIDPETGCDEDFEWFLEALHDNWDEWAGEYAGEMWDDLVEWAGDEYEAAFPQDRDCGGLPGWVEAHADRLIPGFIDARYEAFKDWAWENKWRED